MKKIFAALLCAMTLVNVQAQDFLKTMKLPELPTDPAFETREYHVKSMGNDIFGYAFVPKNVKGKMPLVIMSHGYNGDPVLYYELCDRLAKDGYIAYIFDFCGGSVRTRSTGKTTDMSLRTEQQNLTDIIHDLKAWDNVDPNRIFLVGESQGGIVSALTAAALRDEIKAIALMYPAFSIPIGAQKNYKSVNDVPETLDIMGLKLSRKYYADILNMNVYQEISKFDKEVIIIHGDHDTLVPLTYSEQALPSYKHVMLRVIPDAPHGFYQPEWMHINAELVHNFFNTQK